MAKGDKSTTPGEIKSFFNDTDFPLSKDELIIKAKIRGADKGIIFMLHQIREKEYGSLLELMKEIDNFL